MSRRTWERVAVAALFALALLLFQLSAKSSRERGAAYEKRQASQR
ncbi:MAG: hypothetical protein JWP27_2095 [Flaviaesturariibacter sp.]|nr:hypothetical protein [Flaviaesturariibacter sp.]